MNDTNSNEVNKSAIEPNQINPQNINPVQSMQDISSASVKSVVDQEQVPPVKINVPVSSLVTQNIDEPKVVETISSDLAVPEDVSVVTNKKETTVSKEEDIAPEKTSNKLPIVVLSIFIVLFILIGVYFYVFMTPTRIFNKAIDDIFDTTTSFVESLKNNKSKAIKYNINSKIEAGETTELLDGFLLNTGIDINLKNPSLKFHIKTDSSKAKIKQKDNYDSQISLKDGGIYVTNKKLEEKYTEKVALYKESELTKMSYNKIDNAIKITEKIKDEIFDIVKNDKLNRKIVLKKVNDQTAIALNVSCILNNDEINDIYKKVLNKILEDESTINKIYEIIGYSSEEEVKNIIKKMLDKKVSINNIEVNLYTNLANTRVLSLNIKIDDESIELDNLNGYFYVLVKKTNEHEVKIEYDSNKGSLNGKGYFDKTYSHFYTTLNYTKVNNKEGNLLNISFYNKEVSGKDEIDKSNIILKFNSILDIDDDNPEISILGKNDSMEKNQETESSINESMNRLNHYIEYAKRVVLYNLLDNEKYASEVCKKAIIDRIDRQYNNGEEYLDINDIKKEIEESKEYCNKNGTYAYLYNGSSKIEGEYSDFPNINDSVFNWVCLNEKLDTKKEKELNVNNPNEIDLDKYEDIIIEKLESLNVEVIRKSVDIESLTITPEQKDLKVGETFKILSAYEPTNATKTKLTWKSSNTKVASVSEEGVVKAKSKGTAKITATTQSGKKGEITINVK